MENKDLAAKFEEMADLLEIQGGDVYRIRAFRRISRVLENMREPATMRLRSGTLEQVPGIAEGGARRIKEFLASGTCGDLRRLHAQLGTGVRELLTIRGIGVKTIKQLHGMGIGSLAQLEAVARAGRLKDLPGLGDRTAERILEAIANAKKDIGRVLLPESIVLGTAVVRELCEDASVIRAELAGSVRRRKSTVGDLDVLVASNAPGAVIARFVSLPQVEEVILKGRQGRASVRASSGQQIDLRVLHPDEFGAGLHYFTGSQQHNIYVRARGNRRQLKISDHGIFRRSDEHRISPGRQEEEIFAAVGLPFIPPELRENCGELEAAEKGQLPSLITEDQLRGDLSVYGGGRVGEYAAAARRLGLEYVAVASATKRRLDLYGEQAGIRLLAGVATQILPNGELDADPAHLQHADWVVAAADTALDLPRGEQTARLVKAMESGVVDCLAHPTNRIIDERDPIDVDMEKLFRAAVRCGVTLEIDSDPRRLDLDDVSCRRARELSVLMTINAVASTPDELARRTWGVYAARRGWLERKDVLNAQSVNVLEDRRQQRLRKTAVAGAGYVPEAPAAKRAREKDLTALAKSLARRPLAEAVLTRLEAYFGGAPDPTLDEALRTLSENPLLKAYELLMTR